MRASLLVLVVVGALAVSATPAFAAGPSTLGVSGWQIYATNTQVNNPSGNTSVHGNPAEFAGAPATPGLNDSGWADCGPSAPVRFGRNMCPSPTTIGMAVTSILSGCWTKLNFTWFQALVSIPVGTNVSQFSVNMSGADDGARISLVNSAYPNGVSPANAFIYQGTQQATGDLSSYVVPGEVNRVIITQVDDCAVGNNLNSAQVFLNGTVIPPAPSDTTPPTDAPVASASGWSNSDVTVNWNWADGGSGIDPANCTQSSTSAGEGAITLTSTCADKAGNTASDSYTVHVDKTAPTASPSYPSGWTNSDATVNWNWADGSSGIDPANCTQSSTSTGEGTITMTSTCADVAGNSSSDSVTVQVDKTAPTIAYSGATTYTVDQTVSIACSATDSLSGVATSTCAGASGAAWSFGLGTHSLSASATDNAGNTGSGSVTFTVTVDGTSLCNLVEAWAKNKGIANSLCTKIRAAEAAGARGQTKTKQNNINAFDNEVSAQSGKGFTAAQGRLLVQFAAAL